MIKSNWRDSAIADIIAKIMIGKRAVSEKKHLPNDIVLNITEIFNEPYVLGFYIMDLPEFHVKICACYEEKSFPLTLEGEAQLEFIEGNLSYKGSCAGLEEIAYLKTSRNIIDNTIYFSMNEKLLRHENYFYEKPLTKDNKLKFDNFLKSLQTELTCFDKNFPYLSN